MIKKIGTIELSRGVWAKLYWKVLESIPSGDIINVYITDKKNKRSLQQNAYFHGVIVKILSGHTGYTPQEMKNELALMFYPIQHITLKGEEITVPGKSSEQNTKQMTDIIDQIRHWSSEELGCYIPAPNEVPDELIIQYLENR